MKKYGKEYSFNEEEVKKNLKKIKGSEDLVELARRLCRLLDEKDLSEMDVVRGTEKKISKASFNSYIKGEQKPSVEKIIILAKFFEVPTDYLLGLSNLSVTDEDLKIVNTFTGLTDKAIKRLSLLVKETKDEIGLKELAIDKIKTINYLLENEEDYKILENITSFLWRTYRTNDFLGQEFVEVVDKSGNICLISVSDLENTDILQIQRQLYALKKKAEDENNSKYKNKKK